ncbi:MAG TPA: MOSC domain-containing protein [Streptosporangiaceae bacterium]
MNVGRGRPAEWAGRIGRTAIDKRPCPGPVTIGRLGAGGDEQVDQKHHGGPYQAVYAYAREDLDWWTEQLGRELANGVFGENITTAGLDVSGALLGETWRLGTAVVQIASVRIPCGSFAGWMGERHWVKRFAAAARPGAYLRVLEEGEAGSGDRIEVLSRPAESVTVSEAMRAYYGDAELMRRLVAAPGLDPQWKETAASVLARAVPQEPAVPREPAAG